MNSKNFALFVGIFLLAQGLLGLVIGDGNLGGVWNVNIGMDFLRIALGIFLISGSFAKKAILKVTLLFFGLFYVGMFFLGVISPSLIGLAPDYVGFSGQVLRIFLGSVAIFMAVRLHVAENT